LTILSYPLNLALSAAPLLKDKNKLLLTYFHIV
jgi:hypothetical protein